MLFFIWKINFYVYSMILFSDIIDTYIYIYIFFLRIYDSILFEPSIIMSLKTLLILHNYIKILIFFKKIFIFYFNFIINFGHKF